MLEREVLEWTVIGHDQTLMAYLVREMSLCIPE